MKVTGYCGEIAWSGRIKIMDMRNCLHFSNLCFWIYLNEVERVIVAEDKIYLSDSKISCISGHDSHI